MRFSINNEMISTASCFPSSHWNTTDSDPSALELWLTASDRRGAVALLNLGGEIELGWVGGTRKRVRAGTLNWLRQDVEMPLIRVKRPVGKRFETLVMYYPDVWLRAKLTDLVTPMPVALEEILLGPAPAAALVTTELLPADHTWARTWMAPHLCPAARQLLDEARLTEFLLRTIFTAPATLGSTLQSRTQRLAAERVAKAKAILLNRLDEPLALDLLAQQVGTTASHLSRTFSESEGISIILWFRKERIERAAKLIATGKCNVSEAALEVGYQSLSHFSRAFREEKGCNPSAWPARKSN